MMERILTGLKEKQCSRSTSFLALAREIAADREPSIDVIEKTLADANKTAGELGKLVTTLKRRKMLAAKITDPTERTREREELRKTIEQADAVLQKADEKHTHAVIPASRRLRQIDEEEQRAAEARTELIHGCPDEPLVKKYKDLNAELSALRDKGHALRRTVGGKRSEAIDLQREVSAANRTGDRCDFIEKLENANFQAEKAERELPAVVTRIAEAEAELVTTEAKMLVP